MRTVGLRMECFLPECSVGLRLTAGNSRRLPERRLPGRLAVKDWIRSCLGPTRSCEPWFCSCGIVHHQLRQGYSRSLAHRFGQRSPPRPSFRPWFCGRIVRALTWLGYFPGPCWSLDPGRCSGRTGRARRLQHSTPEPEIERKIACSSRFASPFVDSAPRQKISVRGRSRGMFVSHG